jgi:dynein heavy chain
LSYINKSLGYESLPNFVPIDDILKLDRDPIYRNDMENNHFLKSEIQYSEEKKVHIDSSLEGWKNDIMNMVFHIKGEISNIPCFYAHELGASRANQKVHIFEESDQFVSNMLVKLEATLNDIFKVPNSLLNIIGQHAYILDIDIKKYKKQYKENDYPVDHYKLELEQYKEAREAVQKAFDNEILCTGLFLIKCDKLKKQFLHRINELDVVLFSCIKKKMQENNIQIEEEVDKILEVINKEPDNIEELTDIKNFIRELDKKMIGVNKAINEVMKKLSLMEDHQHRLKEEEFNKTWISFSRPLDIFRSRINCNKRLAKDEKEFYEDLRAMNAGLGEELNELKVDFEILQRVEELDDYESAVAKCDTLFERIDTAIETAEVANRRENLFKLRLTDFREYGRLKHEFIPYNSMWNLAREYFYKINNWTDGNLGDIDRDQLTGEVNNACTTLNKLEKVNFREKRITAHIASNLRKYYEKFKPNLPLIFDLRNPGLKSRHWRAISDAVGFEMDGDLHVSLKELLEKGIMTFKEIINDISDTASREAKLEDTIVKMRTEWRDIKFELNEFRTSESWVLKGAEPIWELLDEHIVKTMTIASSPYVKYLYK